MEKKKKKTREIYLVVDWEGDVLYASATKELAEKSIREEQEEGEEDYHIEKVYFYEE